MTLEQALRLIELEKAMQSAVSQAKQFVYDRLKKGNKVDGWKLVQKLKNRQWKASEDVIEKELLDAGVPPDVLYRAPRLKTPGELEKSDYGGIVKDYFIRDSDRIVLAPSTDRRRAVNYSSAREVFENVENQQSSDT